MLQTSHLILCHASPHISSHQQTQLTNLMLQLQKAKQLWKTDQVPWKSLSQRSLGGLKADSRVGREGEQYSKCLSTQAAQENHLRSFEKHHSPNTDVLADTVTLGWGLGIWIFFKSPCHTNIQTGLGSLMVQG